MKTKSKTWKKDLGDAELNVLMKPHIEELMKKTMPRQNSTFEKDDPSGPKEDEASTANSKKSKTDDNRQTKETHDSKLSETEIQYLESVHEFPNLSVTARGERLGHSAYMNNKIKKKFIEAEYLLEFPVNLGLSSRGNVKFMELLDKGYLAIGKPIPKAWDFQCGPEHRFYQKAGHRWYTRKGYCCSVEMKLSEKRADLGITKDGKVIAVEFEMTPKNAVANVQKDLEAGFDRVMVACKNSKVKNSVIKKLDSVLTQEQWEKVKVLLLQDFQFIKEMLNKTRN